MFSDMQAPSKSHSEGQLQCIGQLTMCAELDCDKLRTQDIRTAVAAVSHHAYWGYDTGQLLVPQVIKFCV